MRNALVPLILVLACTACKKDYTPADPVPPVHATYTISGRYYDGCGGAPLVGEPVLLFTTVGSDQGGASIHELMDTDTTDMNGDFSLSYSTVDGRYSAYPFLDLSIAKAPFNTMSPQTVMYDVPRNTDLNSLALWRNAHAWVRYVLDVSDPGTSSDVLNLLIQEPPGFIDINGPFTSGVLVVTSFPTDAALHYPGTMGGPNHYYFNNDLRPLLTTLNVCDTLDIVIPIP